MPSLRHPLALVLLLAGPLLAPGPAVAQLMDRLEGDARDVGTSGTSGLPAPAGAQQAAPAPAPPPSPAPAPAQAPAVPAPTAIYVVIDGQQAGPMDAASFMARMGSAEAAEAALVWLPGMADWAPASSVPPMQPVLAAMRAPPEPAAASMTLPEMQAFLAGAWVSEPFVWTIDEVPYDAIVHVRLMPGGRFEGATVFLRKEDRSQPPQFAHEAGQWEIAPSDGGYALTRDIGFATIVGSEVVETGRMTDTFVLSATGPDRMESQEGIAFVRVPEGG